MIELLVVTTVIAVLLVLLLPVIGMVRDAARQTRCLANTRQLAVAFMAYGADNRGAIPLGWNQSNSAMNWCVATEPYLDGFSFRRQYGVQSTRRPFGCTNVVLGTLRPDGTWNMGDGNGYGINIWPSIDIPGQDKFVAGVGSSTTILTRNWRLAQISNPTQRAWAGDANDDWYGRDYTRVDAASWRVIPATGIPDEAVQTALKTTSGGLWIASIGKRHRKGVVNTIFFDGHASSISVQKLI